jgi:hypothetical protein
MQATHLNHFHTRSEIKPCIAALGPILAGTSPSFLPGAVADHSVLGVGILVLGFLAWAIRSERAKQPKKEPKRDPEVVCRENNIKHDDARGDLEAEARREWRKGNGPHRK